MPKFCANLEFMFTEHPFMGRFAAAAEAGFRAVEFHYPYDKDIDQLVDCLGTHNLEQVLINGPKGNQDGDHGLACNADRRGEFEESIGLAIDYARAMGTSRVHVMAGRRPDGASADVLLETYTDNMRFAARAMGEHGIKALIEGVNSKIDVPGYFLDRPSDALKILRSMEEPNLYLQFDFYHAQIMEGGLTRLFHDALPLTAHIQIADTPGRHEPGTGEINYAYVFKMIDDAGWDGWVGCEYRPKGATLEGLAWMAPYA
ncbi:MAG: TIM barrel protein [Rhodospirillales bacterium]|nr:TIM barrel protein [Rhodospirillales bacterium]